MKIKGEICGCALNLSTKHYWSQFCGGKSSKNFWTCCHGPVNLYLHTGGGWISLDNYTDLYSSRAFQILTYAGIDSTYIYSSLDPSARKINVAKFQHKKVKVLIVTDLAARGIDIPLLDNVINVNFPAKSKLFVHRVGEYLPVLIGILM